MRERRAMPPRNPSGVRVGRVERAWKEGGTMAGGREGGLEWWHEGS